MDNTSKIDYFELDELNMYSSNSIDINNCKDIFSCSENIIGFYSSESDNHSLSTNSNSFQSDEENNILELSPIPETNYLQLFPSTQDINIKIDQNNNINNFEHSENTIKQSSSSSSSLSSESCLEGINMCDDEYSNKRIKLECNIDESDCKQRKLARKAELARLARKRKKCRLLDLEAQVESLQNELKLLKQENAQINLNNQNNNSAKENVNLAINNLININNNDKIYLSRGIEKLIETQRLLENESFIGLRNVKNSLIPILPLQFLSWIMNQNDNILCDETGLWFSLWRNELNCSPQQEIQLKSLRLTIRKQQKFAIETEKAFKKLDAAANKYFHQQTENLERIRAILDETQLAKYVTWCKNYGEICVKIKNNHDNIE